MNHYLLNAYGIDVPLDVVNRGSRLKRKYGRENYLDDWLAWEYRKTVLGVNAEPLPLRTIKPILGNKANPPLHRT